MLRVRPRPLIAALAAVLLAARHASAQIEEARWAGPDDAGRFGYSIANVGDVDADGVDDLLVGAPFAVTNGTSIGTVLLFSRERHRPWTSG